ncbi:hypothetical protein IAQ61_011773 [Plenodomus lingam]|uniref:uncharacterized protein n=1 Tax=Leptosphaeria maculans TaxID=5022 RepID=UPI0033204508|nr:hypothetical protein IAQ61_011773 [Plenodomus lingam]
MFEDRGPLSNTYGLGSSPQSQQRVPAGQNMRPRPGIGRDARQPADRSSLHNTNGQQSPFRPLWQSPDVTMLPVPGLTPDVPQVEDEELVLDGLGSPFQPQPRNPRESTTTPPSRPARDRAARRRRTRRWVYSSFGPLYQNVRRAQLNRVRPPPGVEHNARWDLTAWGGGGRAQPPERPALLPGPDQWGNLLRWAGWVGRDWYERSWNERGWGRRG